MSKTQNITPENIKEVLLNSCFNERGQDDIIVYSCEEIEIILRNIKSQDDFFYTMWNKYITNSKCKTNDFDIFLYALQKHIILTPLPAEESILEWWEKNKVYRFNLFETNDGYQLYKGGAVNFEMIVEIKKNNKNFIWTNDRIKSTILKVCELFKN